MLIRFLYAVVARRAGEGTGSYDNVLLGHSDSEKRRFTNEQPSPKSSLNKSVISQDIVKILILVILHAENVVHLASTGAAACLSTTQPDFLGGQDIPGPTPATLQRPHALW